MADDEKFCCESDHPDEPRKAVASLVMVDSTSASNITFACQECALTEVAMWLVGIGGDTEGYEIRRLT